MSRKKVNFEFKKIKAKSLVEIYDCAILSCT